MILSRLRYPVVQAPMSAGIGTPRLAAAVSDVGALGFLPGGRVSAAALRSALDELRHLTDEPFGINFWVPASRNRARERAGDAPAPGMQRPAREDADWELKLALAAAYQTPVISFSFGIPSEDVLRRARAAGAELWFTANTPDDAWAAEAAGADVLILQGAEASAAARWRKSETLSLQSLISLTRERCDLPIVGGGGIADGASMAAALAATATAVQLGSALMLAREAGTSEDARQSLRRRVYDSSELRTVVSASSGGRQTEALLELSAGGASLRRLAGPEHDDAPIYAGQTYRLAREAPAATIIRGLVEDAYAALEGARLRLRSSLDR
jgi:nitronate monooxygenase